MNEAANLLDDDGLAAAIREIALIVFDFDGVFTDNAVYVTEDGQEAVRCWRSDGLGLSKLRSLDVPMMVVSTETNPVVSARCGKLKLDCVQGCPDKGAELRAIMAEKGLRAEQVAYVGNDINDADCLKTAGLPIVVADAHPDVLPLASWVTKTPGGKGAVREVCDFMYQVLSAAA